MTKLVKIKFFYDDGTSNMIDDPRAAMMFQSRCNSSGILSGMEGFLVEGNENKPETIKQDNAITN